MSALATTPATPPAPPLALASASGSRKIPIVLPGHTRPIAEVSFPPPTCDGTFLVSACHDKTPMLRLADSGDWVGSFVGHKGAVWSAKLNDSCLLAATAGGDFTARVWDAITGAELFKFDHKHIVKSVDFSGDSSRIATGGHEGLLRVYELNCPGDDPVVVDVNKDRRGGEGKLKISKVEWDGNSIFVGCDDGSVKVYDMSAFFNVTSEDNNTENQAEVLLTTLEVRGEVMDMELSRDLNIMTVASGDEVSFFDTTKGGDYKLLKRHKMPKKVEDRSYDCNFKNEGGASLYPDGKKFIAGGGSLWVFVFDFETGKEIEKLKGHHGPVRCVRYNKGDGGNTYASGSEDGTIRLWSDL